MIAAGIEGRFQNVKVNGRHLGAQDRVVLAHFLGKGYLFDSGGSDRALLVLFFPNLDGGEQRADPDSGSAEIVDLIDFEAGINLVRAGENITNLIGGDGVQSAAKGIQLDQIQVFHGFHKACRGIEPGVIHPLVGYDQWTLRLRKMGDGILCQHGNVIGDDQLRNPVIDLRVNMVGASGKHNSPPAAPVQIIQHFLAFFLHVSVCAGKLGPGETDSLYDVAGRNFRKFFHQGLGNGFLIAEGKKRISQNSLPPADLLHIVLDILRVGGDDGTVIVVVGLAKLVSFIKKSRIKDKVHLLVNEPFDMAVCKLGGIAFGFAGDGFDTKLVNLPVGNRREHHLKIKSRKKGKPEGIVFV